MGDVLAARASTHAKPYHAMIVDGHRNEARGLDIKDDLRGLLNGMRTLHYFTIPDTDHLQDAGGNGPRRRLYLKCETFGVFVNKISSANAKASLADGMKPRGYKLGDVIESIAHGLSLVNSYWTPKDAPGIQKENLLEAQKRVLDETERKLAGAGLRNLAKNSSRTACAKAQASGDCWTTSPTSTKTICPKILRTAPPPSQSSAICWTVWRRPPTTSPPTRQTGWATKS